MVLSVLPTTGVNQMPKGEQDTQHLQRGTCLQIAQISTGTFLLLKSSHLGQWVMFPLMSQSFSNFIIDKNGLQCLRKAQIPMLQPSPTESKFPGRKHWTIFILNKYPVIMGVWEIVHRGLQNRHL